MDVLDDDFGFGPPAPPPAAAQHPAAPGAPQRPQARPLAQRIAPRRPTFKARATAGLGVIAAAGGAGIGAAVAGPPGAVVGLTAVGAARNLFRAQGLRSDDPGERSDAARSLALGFVGCAVAGYFAWKIWKDQRND